MNDQLIQAGRAFKAAFDGLERGLRAVMRREDIPSSTPGFWKCMEAAEKVFSAGSDERTEKKLAANIRLFEQLVPVLDLLKGSHSGKDLGAFLKGQTKVALSRVEAVLTSRDRDEVIENLESIAGQLKDEAIDFGVLFKDLWWFGPNVGRERVIRQWAQSYFGRSH